METPKNKELAPSMGERYKQLKEIALQEIAKFSPAGDPRIIFDESFQAAETSLLSGNSLLIAADNLRRVGVQRGTSIMILSTWQRLSRNVPKTNQ